MLEVTFWKKIVDGIVNGGKIWKEVVSVIDLKKK